MFGSKKRQARRERRKSCLIQLIIIATLIFLIWGLSTGAIT